MTNDWTKLDMPDSGDDASATSQAPEESTPPTASFQVDAAPRESRGVHSTSSSSWPQERNSSTAAITPKMMKLATSGSMALP